LAVLLCSCSLSCVSPVVSSRTSILRSTFSFQSCPAHRDLHSFPTRRSSDLRAGFGKAYRDLDAVGTESFQKEQETVAPYRWCSHQRARQHLHRREQP